MTDRPLPAPIRLSRLVFLARHGADAMERTFAIERMDAAGTRFKAQGVRPIAEGEDVLLDFRSASLILVQPAPLRADDIEPLPLCRRLADFR